MWSDLVEDARRAPSPHNTQAWLLEIDDDRRARVSSRAERLLPVEDPDHRFLTGGIGIFVEALRVAAAARGRELRDTFVGPAGPDALVARLELVAGEARADELPLLLRRRTSRLPYDGRPAPQAALDELARVAAGFGHTFHASSDPAFVRWVVGLNAATLSTTWRRTTAAPRSDTGRARASARRRRRPTASRRAAWASPAG
jgi:nitroreductase